MANVADSLIWVVWFTKFRQAAAHGMKMQGESSHENHYA